MAKRDTSAEKKLSSALRASRTFLSYGATISASPILVALRKV